MNYNILTTKKFEREIKKLAKKFPSIKQEYAALIDILKKNPKHGTPLGLDCFKIRLAIQSKGEGKRGGARIITFAILKQETIYILTIYDKSERANISDKELKELIKKI